MKKIIISTTCLFFFLAACSNDKPLTKKEQEIMLYSGKQGLKAYRRSQRMKSRGIHSVLDKGAKANEKMQKNLNKINKVPNQLSR